MFWRKSLIVLIALASIGGTASAAVPTFRGGISSVAADGATKQQTPTPLPSPNQPDAPPTSPTPTATPLPSHSKGAPSPQPTTTQPQQPTPTSPPGAPKPNPPVVVLDAGHNGGNSSHPSEISQLVPAGFGEVKACNTVGTSTNNGYAEHAFTFDVTNRVAQILTAQGIRVVKTRTDDLGVGPCVDRRAAIGNAQNADAVVGIHGDGSLTGRGFHVIEASRLPAGLATGAQSHQLAVSVHDNYLAKSDLPAANYIGRNGFDQRDDLAGLNLSLRPSIFIECGNMRDATDASVMAQATGRDQIAAGIADGIIKFLNSRN